LAPWSPCTYSSTTVYSVGLYTLLRDVKLSQSQVSSPLLVERTHPTCSFLFTSIRIDSKFIAFVRHIQLEHPECASSWLTTRTWQVAFHPGHVSLDNCASPARIALWHRQTSEIEFSWNREKMACICCPSPGSRHVCKQGHLAERISRVCATPYSSSTMSVRSENLARVPVPPFPCLNFCVTGYRKSFLGRGRQFGIRTMLRQPYRVCASKRSSADCRLPALLL
jgi:hypothetical protein